MRDCPSKPAVAYWMFICVLGLSFGSTTPWKSIPSLALIDCLRESLIHLLVVAGQGSRLHGLEILRFVIIGTLGGSMCAGTLCPSMRRGSSSSSYPQRACAHRRTRATRSASAANLRAIEGDMCARECRVREPSSRAETLFNHPRCTSIDQQISASQPAQK